MSDAFSTTSPRDERFTDALNRHGYSFCNRVIKEADSAHRDQRSAWLFEVAEFPVVVGSAGTRIDFILSAQGTNIWLTCECKRVNPAFSEWLFAKNTYVRRGHNERYIAEYSHKLTASFLSGGVNLSGEPSAPYCHVGISVKTGHRGDPQGGTNDAIEDAATQVIKGVNGLVTHLAKNTGSLGSKQRRVLMPIVFTTAKLFVSDADLTEVDLETGTIAAEKLQAREVPFLYYQYHLTPTLKHQENSLDVFGELRSIVAADYIRTIAVVNGAKAQEFLCRLRPGDLETDPIKGN